MKGKKKYGTFYGVTFPEGGEFEYAEYPTIKELVEDLGLVHGFTYQAANAALTGRASCEIGGLEIRRVRKAKPGKKEYTVCHPSGEITVHRNLMAAVRQLPGVSYDKVAAIFRWHKGEKKTILALDGKHAGAKITRHKQG